MLQDIAEMTCEKEQILVVNVHCTDIGIWPVSKSHIQLPISGINLKKISNPTVLQTIRQYGRPLLHRTIVGIIVQHMPILILLLRQISAGLSSSVMYFRRLYSSH